MIMEYKTVKLQHVLTDMHRITSHSIIGGLDICHVNIRMTKFPVGRSLL